MSIDFRACLSAISDVIMNRPKPLRVFDQIYMKLPDMLLQAELISRWFDGKRILFIGDGDAIGLSLVHLSSQKLLPGKPEHITVLDFDERVVYSVNHFATHYKLSDYIHSELYNVAAPLPPQQWQSNDAFYTNPPWGASNDGNSVLAFINRGIEGAKAHAFGCVVIGDHKNHAWTHQVQIVTQRLLLDHGFRVAEMLPEFHKYHLDDAPELTSCSLLVERCLDTLDSLYNSKSLTKDQLANFYGADNPLRYRYIHDLTNGGKLATRDVEMEPLEETT